MTIFIGLLAHESGRQTLYFHSVIGPKRSAGACFKIEVVNVGAYSAHLKNQSSCPRLWLQGAHQIFRLINQIMSSFFHWITQEPRASQSLAVVIEWWWILNCRIWGRLSDQSCLSYNWSWYSLKRNCKYTDLHTALTCSFQCLNTRTCFVQSVFCRWWMKRLGCADTLRRHVSNMSMILIE